MQVPFLDLQAQYEAVIDDVNRLVAEVVASRAFCNGPLVRRAEQELAAYCGCAEAVAVSSGTDALLVSLMALGIGPGDEVITTPFTFFATAGVVWRAGARPVFVDIEADTFNIDPAKIEAAVTERTRAIIPVHLYGQMADMDAIMAIADRHDLAVIEDAAQAIGATYRGRPACSIGTTGCLSFYPTKNLGAMGDAGMVLTQDAALAARLRQLRNHGQGSTYIHDSVGGNFRADSLAMAGVAAKLPRLAAWTDTLRRHGARYDALLAGCDGVTTPAVRDGCEPVYHQYVLRCADRDGLKAHLAGRDVASGVYYPLCLHLQPCFAALGYSAGDLPVAEQASREVLALPIYPEMTDEQVEYVAASVKAFFGAS
ncbi:MAG: DegT/DnrJ/EryC1/StrS family aminotransferase [Planctomycetes bacterium]|nr:DegT/DnrJ/EryC1/StrS family aminotransferase [Planctomycetota bacterium]